jgi:cation transport ATPase
VESRIIDDLGDVTLMESLPLEVPAGIATNHEAVYLESNGLTRFIGMRPKLLEEEIEALKAKSDHFDSYRKEGEATIFYLKGKKVFGVFPVDDGGLRESCRAMVK